MDVWVPMSSNANGSSILHCLLENPRLRASRYLEVEIDINDKKYVFYRQPHYRCCMQKKKEIHPYDLDALVFYPILDERLEAACCGLYYLLVYHSWFSLCLNRSVGYHITYCVLNRFFLTVKAQLREFATRTWPLCRSNTCSLDQSLLETTLPRNQVMPQR